MQAIAPSALQPALANVTTLRPDLPGADLDALESACFGAGLSAEAEHQIRLAGLAWHSELLAEAHLERAFAMAPHHPATHIALYRFHFYRNRLPEALFVGLRCLSEAARLNNLPADWRAVQAGDADFGAYSALPRFYLFSLKACVYLRLRLGQLESGADMLNKLLELDPKDRVNGSILRDVLGRLGQDDDE